MTKLIAMLALLTGCVVQVGATGPAPVTYHQFPVDMDPSLGEARIQATIEGCNWVNSMLGRDVFVPAVREGTEVQGRMWVRPAPDDNTNLIGWMGGFADACVMDLRSDADFGDVAHEAMHCLWIDHSDDPNNLMYPDKVPTAWELTDEQIAEANEYLAGW